VGPSPEFDYLVRTNGDVIEWLKCPACGGRWSWTNGEPEKFEDPPTHLERELAPVFDELWVAHPDSQPTQVDLAERLGNTTDGLSKRLRCEKGQNRRECLVAAKETTSASLSCVRIVVRQPVLFV
jgi:hypothetical protein